MKSLKLFAVVFSVIHILGACSGQTDKSNELKQEEEKGFLVLSNEQLESLGIFITDTAIMYNNTVDGVGSLDLVIRDREYIGNSAIVKQTSLPFYPRFITTLDTIQRTIYMLSGSQLRSEEEAQKWQSFDNLVPVIVEQKVGDYQFGETLVFWMTKTPELERLIKSFRK
jgi:hypothetical protein